MSPEQPAQEYNHVRWGTMMPATVKVGSKIVQLRARGEFSAAVNDRTRLTAQVPDLENLEAYLKNLVVSTVLDLIAILSQQASSVDQLKAVSTGAAQTLQEMLTPKFQAVGLQLKAVVIEAVESL